MGVEMDPRWAMMVDFDMATLDPRALTFDHFKDIAHSWAELVPANFNVEGPIALLRTARSLFIHSWFDYEFMVLGCLVGIQAVEAAFFDKYRDISDGKSFAYLIRHASEVGDLDSQEAMTIDAGRRLRNSLSHPKMPSTFSIGMAAPVLEVSHRLVVKIVTAAQSGTSVS